MNLGDHRVERVENSVSGRLRASWNEELPLEIKSQIMESERVLLILLKPKLGENAREQNENTL